MTVGDVSLPDRRRSQTAATASCRCRAAFRVPLACGNLPFHNLHTKIRLLEEKMTTRGVGVVVCLLGAAVVARLLVGIDTVAARSAGPPVNRNGVSGQYCTLCHTTNALNSGEGSVRVIGLPSAWLPGETYAIQVIVSHPSARRSGFQMSAVTSSGEQAGQFVVGADGRSQVETGDVNGKPVQFIQHNSLGSAIDGSNVFRFTYQTPSDGGVGNIRFNVAGNAANGGGT